MMFKTRTQKKARWLKKGDESSDDNIFLERKRTVLKGERYDSKVLYIITSVGIQEYKER